MRPFHFYFFLFFVGYALQNSNDESNQIVIKIIISDENEEEGIPRKNEELQIPEEEGEFSVVTMHKDVVVDQEEIQVEGEDLQIAEEEELFINEEIILDQTGNQELINEEETTLFSPLSTIIIKPASRIFQVYSDKGTGAHKDISVWRADLTADPGYYSLGDVAMGAYVTPQTIYIASAEGDELQPPVDYLQIWEDTGSGGDQDGSFWQPIPPIGYFCLGNVAQDGYSKPSTDLIRCVKDSLVRPTQNILSVWDDKGSGAPLDIGVWEIHPNAGDTLGLGLNLFVSVSYYGNPTGLDLRVLDRQAIKDGPFAWQIINLNTPSKFAPLIFLHPEEQYFPDSTLNFLQNVYPNNGFLVTKEPLGCDSCTDLTFLIGLRPDKNDVPVYAQIINRQENDQTTNIVDFVYWTFYPYHKKRICIGAFVKGVGCVGGYTTYGNHVGDWEYVVLRLIDGYATQVYFSSHPSGAWMNWGDKTLGMNGSHFIVFAAKGSHDYYPDASRHTYQDVIFNTVVDDTGNGILWDTEKTLVPFYWQTPGTYSDPMAFMNIQERWGNPKSGCGTSKKMTGECVLDDGPIPPMSTDVANPSIINF